jgi:bilirubin oxidase
VSRRWHDPISENPGLDATEIWEFQNFTPDVHPIHIHQVQFQVIGRGPDGRQPPEGPELGFKDTVVALPGQITRVKARFDLPGLYVWHCHTLEHEDNEMMLRYFVGPIPRGAAEAGVGGTPGLDPALAAAGATMLAAAAVGGAVLARRQRADPPPA